MDLTYSVKMDAPICAHGGVNISMCLFNREVGYSTAFLFSFSSETHKNTPQHLQYLSHVHFNCLLDSNEYCVLYLI